ncbi:unnamed protein product [Coregonus sp. 'balchen']|nr:unnamed protein product [Coregonus sp. 'balchen']
MISIKYYDVIQWGRQSHSQDRQLQLLGYLYTTHQTPESSFKDQFKLRGTTEEYCDSSISNLTQEDSAVYFCAAREHRAAYPISDLQNPHLKYTVTPHTFTTVF